MYTFFFFSKSANSSYLAENDEDFDSHTSKVLNFVIEYALITKKKDLWSMSFDIDEARSFCQLNRPCTERAEYPFLGPMYVVRMNAARRAWKFTFYLYP